MKCRMTFSLTLTLSLLLSLVSLPSTAQAAARRFRADLGTVTLPATQTLRVTVAGTDGNDTIRVRFRWMQYAEQSCSGMPQVCRHVVVSQGATPVETLGSDDTLSFDVQGTGAGVRVVVESNSPNARVLGITYDPSTKCIVGFFETEMLSMT